MMTPLLSETEYNRLNEMLEMVHGDEPLDYVAAKKISHEIVATVLTAVQKQLTDATELGYDAHTRSFFIFDVRNQHIATAWINGANASTDLNLKIRESMIPKRLN